ncbi:dihydrolipoyl dehydrogenase [Halobacteria archaeon AArc-m2/3/4]|uniref:Dihydrolipoyl dehydrogenase n=1 Tax=Natronoglomus mannanivorans TaxID=2979990 RepID=A0ABT2QAT5_9EURY|nr:dihydrolipoyl dehydrogenase [Halobacteria archaeon AArc-m2/3/4]
MEEFDIVVLGGGSGSQVATAAADDGLEAAVLEPGPLGGACITRGCVPSKALLHRADVCEEIRRAERFGVDAEIRDLDFDAITDAVHDTVYEKADRQHESLEANENVTLYEAAGRFVDDQTIALGDGDGGEFHGDTDRIRGEVVVIAVGSRPVAPPIDGLEDVAYRTSDTALYLDEQPDDLVIVGGGYIAAELGYFFSAIGTDVSIVGRSETLVKREDDAVSDAVTESLAERCDVYTGFEASSVAERDGSIAVEIERSDGNGNEDGDEDENNDPSTLEADELLVATGRTPNTDDLGLENAGVETDEAGHVDVDEFLKTSAENVWALGDVIGDQPFKHVADYEARCVTVNVLEETQQTVDYEAMPHAIFTSPQVASVGRTESELVEADIHYDAATVGYDAAPMGLILDAKDAFVKVLAASDEDGDREGEILGCHIVGPQASTMIHEVVLAMQRCSGTVDDVADTVHVHPALNEAVLAAFDEVSDRSYSTAPDWRDVGE